MPKRITSYTLFVVCPADVEEDVEVIRTVVAELNRTWRVTNSYQLQAVHWRQDATPGVAEDAQQVINRSIGAEYDLLVGFVWTRLGTPTPRAMSGFREEVEAAVARCKRQPTALEVMVFQKTAPVLPDRLDAGQLGLALEFIKHLKNDGVLVGSYQNSEQLAAQLRVHLSHAVHRLSSSGVAGREVSQISAEETDELDEEPGFLELMERSTYYLQRSTASLGRVAEDIRTVGERAADHTGRINRLPRKHGNPNVAGARRILEAAGEDMLTFAQRLDTETPQIAETWQLGLDSTARAIALVPEFDEELHGHVRGLLSAIVQMRVAALSANGKVSSLRHATAVLPPTTTPLRKGRSRMTAALDRFIGEVEKGIADADNLIGLIRGTLGASDSSDAEAL